MASQNPRHAPKYAALLRQLHYRRHLINAALLLGVGLITVLLYAYGGVLLAVVPISIGLGHVFRDAIGASADLAQFTSPPDDTTDPDVDGVTDGVERLAHRVERLRTEQNSIGGVELPPVAVRLVDSNVCFGAMAGISPNSAGVILSTAMQTQFDGDAINSILSHELAHIRNRTMQYALFWNFCHSVALYALIAAGLTGIVTILSNPYGSLLITPIRAVHFAVFLAAIALTFRGAFMAYRTSEYLADMGALSYAPNPEQYPEHLIAVGEQFYSNNDPVQLPTVLHRVVHPATHPPITVRINLLRTALSQ